MAELGVLANQLTRDFDILARESGGAAGTATNQDVSYSYSYSRTFWLVNLVVLQEQLQIKM